MLSSTYGQFLGCGKCLCDFPQALLWEIYLFIELGCMQMELAALGHSHLLSYSHLIQKSVSRLTECALLSRFKSLFH